MPIMFNTLLRDADLPLDEVRLIRHKHQRTAKGITLYELWRDNRKQFDLNESTYNVRFRKNLKATYWASFVGRFGDETMFVGLYTVKYRGLLKKDIPMPHNDDVYKAGK